MHSQKIDCVEKTLSIRIDEDETGVSLTLFDRKTNLAVGRTKFYYTQIKHGATNEKRKTKRKN